MSKVMGLAALGAVLLGAAPARAGWYVQGIPGAGCATDARTTATWEYRNRKLLNTSSDPWQIMVAVCPVSIFAPGAQPREYRITLTDPVVRDSWCRAYAYNGTSHRFHVSEGGGTRQIAGALDYPLGWADSLVEVTFHCLVQSGASIDRIEIVWWRP